eukprot:4791172-Alexandrium_andersonii.AAC.1
MTSSPEILKRACLRCSNEGLRGASGVNLKARAAVYPPRYAPLSFAALQPSTLARAGAYRRP